MDKADHPADPCTTWLYLRMCELARPVDLSLWKKIWIKVAVKVNKRDVKETRCPLGDIEVPLEENMYLRSLIQLEMHPPFWFSMLKSK